MLAAQITEEREVIPTFEKEQAMHSEKQHDKTDKPERGPKPVTISVNGQPVKMPKGKATGAEIKQAAIAAGVAIEPDFNLLLSGKDDLETVQDDETIKLKRGMKFRAVAPDDVS